MAKISTDSIESSSRILGEWEGRDLIFVALYMLFSLAFSGFVHDNMTAPYYIFSFIVSVFLSLRSSFNKNRRNYESIYFLLAKDTSVYRPFMSKEDEDVI